jgi:predicted transposase YbfD/YdcC
MVDSKRIIKDKETNEKRYYISSLPAEAERICKAARAHWSIENCLHWRLDVVYNEDKACIRDDNEAENMSIIRKWALNILNSQKGKSSVKSLQRKACMSFKHMLQILQNSLDN